LVRVKELLENPEQLLIGKDPVKTLLACKFLIFACYKRTSSVYEKLSIVLPVLASIILFSCQKEVSFGNGSGSGGGTGGGGTTGNTLVKTVAKTGTDSVVTIYTYNAIKSWSIKRSPVYNRAQILAMNTGITETHPASSLIYTDQSKSLVVGIDSVSTIVHYDAAAPVYFYRSELSLFGFSLPIVPF